MNLGITKQKAISTTTQGAGAVGGMLLSKGAMSFAPESLNKGLPKIVLGAILLVGSAAVTGKGPVTDLGKGAAFGAGAIQLAEGVAGLIKPTVEGLAEDNKLKPFATKAIAGMAGAETKYVALPSASSWGNTQVVEQQPRVVNNVV